MAIFSTILEQWWPLIVSSCHLSKLVLFAKWCIEVIIVLYGESFLGLEMSWLSANDHRRAESPPGFSFLSSIYQDIDEASMIYRWGEHRRPRNLDNDVCDELLDFSPIACLLSQGTRYATPIVPTYISKPGNRIILLNLLGRCKKWGTWAKTVLVRAAIYRNLKLRQILKTQPVNYTTLEFQLERIDISVVIYSQTGRLELIKNFETFGVVRFENILRR